MSTILLSELKDVDTVAAAAFLGAKLSEAQQNAKTAPGLQNGKPFVILDGKIVYVDAVFDKPARKAGIVLMNDAQSLIALWNIHGVKGFSAMYGSLDPIKFTSVFNDHATGEAGYRDHKAEYVLKHSKEWDLWMKHNGAAAAFGGNEEFGYFVENHASDFLDPLGARMLEIALNFRASNNVAFKNVVRLSDGNVDLAYSEIVTGESAVTTGGATQKVSIPEKFKIAIPVFAGIDQPHYELEARFRFRVAAGGLKIWYDIVEPHKAIEKAFKDIWQKINKGIGQEILLGVA